MKPDWSSKNVPDWANYAAQEASGSWYWYSHRPTYSEICTEWQSPGQRQIIPKVELRPQETLEERPLDFDQDVLDLKAALRDKAMKSFGFVPEAFK